MSYKLNHLTQIINIEICYMSKYYNYMKKRTKHKCVEIDEMEPNLKRTLERDVVYTSTVDGVVFIFVSATCAHVNP